MKKRNMIATSLAVVLAVALLAGGTFTYLTDSSKEVVNEFTTNQNGVDLEESTGEEYDIVPGTSQEKDPTITATYTLDSYVFVEVTDATDELVTWYIANGWTLLSTTETTDSEGNVTTTSVYYMLLEANGGVVAEITWSDVEGDDNTKVYEMADGSYYIWDVSDGMITYYAYVGATGTDATNLFDLTTGNMTNSTTTTLQVLKDNTVYYASSITNEDLVDAENISLTFQAYIIQAEPFADAENAWLVVSGQGEAINENTGVVSTLIEAISEASENDVIALLQDVTAESTITISTNGLTLDLGDHTLTANLVVSSNMDLTLTNGDVESSSGTGIDVNSGSSLTLKNVDVTAAATAVYAYNGADIVIDGGSVTSTLHNAVDVELDSTVTITGSKISAAKIAIYANKATVTITDTSIESSGDSINAVEAWNNSTITITGSTISVTETGSNAVAADESSSVTGDVSYSVVVLTISSEGTNE